MSRRSDGNTSISPENIAGQNLSVGFRPLPQTTPFWSYVGSLIITLFIPSGGGHWAVQGPFTVPAAISLHASLPATSMGVATGELVSSLLQPFWAIPLVAIAGVGVRRVLGFTFASFLLMTLFFGVVYLFFAPTFAPY